MKKTELLFDKIYEHRSFLLKYFIAATVCSVLRTVISVLLPVAVVYWAAYAVLFYIALRMFVFKRKKTDFFSSLTQIMVYVLCIFAVFVLNSVVISVLYWATASTAIAVSLGGVVSELFCLWLMAKVAFKKML